MLIRGQDQSCIINLNCVTGIYIDEDSNVIAYHDNGRNSWLGDYSTEEKAIKVLDMICDTCRNIAFIDEKAVVFQMPQDSEV